MLGISLRRVWDKKMFLINTMEKELQVIRTIHPVGQGAFYTEVLHRENEEDKYVVYDWLQMPIISFACYKEDNRYHPSNYVMKIANNYGLGIGVDEHKDSVLTEDICVYCK